MFGLYFIKTGEFDLTTAKAMGRLMKMREEADYYPEISFIKEEAIKMASDFLNKAKTLIIY